MKMGSRDWLKTIMSRMKTKRERNKQIKVSGDQGSNGSDLRRHSDKDSNNSLISSQNVDQGDFAENIEDIAAIRIQTTFRAFKARRTLCCLKGIQRLQAFANRDSLKKQTSNALNHVQSWNKIQAEIRARRVRMVMEGNIKQKKHENQLKLEAKLQGLEIEWNGGSETKEEIIARIQQREEAALKRERALAYAFSHQWRTNTSLSKSTFLYDIGKGNCEWSWIDQWTAARPWETRAQSASPIKSQINSGSKVSKNQNKLGLKASPVVKTPKSDAKGIDKKLHTSSDVQIANKEG